MTDMPDRVWETISAMQKSVRRGMEVEAGQYFFEMAEAGYFTVAVSRLRTIAFEDVGLGDMTSVMFADTALDRAEACYQKKKGSWRLSAANAILALCRAKKSRLADHFLAVCQGRNAQTLLEIPEYCFDKHTHKGRAMGRGLDHFRQEGALLVNKAGIPDPYEEEAYQIMNSGILEKTSDVKETACEDEEEERKPRGLLGYANSAVQDTSCKTEEAKMKPRGLNKFVKKEE